MKSSLFLLGSVIFLASCGGAEGDKTKAGDKQEAAVSAGGTNYTADTTQSTVTWTGYKVGGQHTGVFKISGGTISADSSGVTAGNFTINVAGITNKDLPAADKAKLEGHLKSADFFEADKYPTASFEITKVEPYHNDSSAIKSKLQGATHLVSGNLTLKGQSKNITFPAKISVNDNELTANADFDIDRTEWGMNYKGPNNPQNWAINKEVNIKLNIVARK
jgi:polyisoprenoid-binding protein YceI